MLDAKPAIHLLVIDGFADWEPAHAVAELRRRGHYRVECVGLSMAPVESMGGVRVLPTRTVAAVEPSDVAAFIVPGGDRWERDPVEPDLEALLRRLDARDTPLAAICGATVAIARLGLLRGRRHTSNGLAYLRAHVPGYSDAGNYVDAPAVRDRKLITAGGLADVEFARELFEELGVLTPGDRSLWAQIFRSGKLPPHSGSGSPRQTLDFSGEWILDRQASALAPGADTIRSGVVRIDHREPTFRCEASFVTAGDPLAYEFELRSDGREIVGTEEGHQSSSALRWDGDVLVFEGRTERPDGPTTIVFRYALFDKGRGLRADEQLRGTDHDQDNVWIFRRR